MMNPNDIRKMPVKVQPYRHQQRAYEFTLGLFGLLPSQFRSNGAALLMEMGTGKSLTTIGVAGSLYEYGRINRLLVVCPLSITGVWLDEFEKFAAFPYSLVVLEGTGEKKKKLLREFDGEGLQVVVVNYESAWRLEAELSAWKPDMIAADEGHKIKSHKTSASKAMHRLGVAARYRMLLTGTPVTNKAIDIFSQYKFLNPAIYGQSFYTFRSKYFFMTGYGQHTPVMKASMEEEFTRRMHSIAFRATKAECLDLPDTTDIVRKVDLEPAAMKIYKSLVDESYAELQNGEEVTTTNVLTRLLRLCQLTGGFLGNDETSTVEQVSNAKLSVLEDLIDSSLQEGKKLVVIARFVPELHAICKLLGKKGIRYSLIMGDVKDRDTQVKQFQTDPEVQVFVGQVATAGMGITLTAASTMIFYSMDYSMSNYEQCRARIHRAGQKYPCTYIHLIGSRTVDTKVLQALRTKANLAKSLVDDWRRGINPFQ